MDVSMRYFKSNHSHADFAAGKHRLYGARYTLGKDLIFGKEFVIKVKDIVCFLTWYHQGVAERYGVDVEKGEELAVLRDLVAGDLARPDFAEYSCHDA